MIGVSSSIRCPHGHAGPFRYVEKIECWRDVVLAVGGRLKVDGLYHTDEGYDEVGTDAYLECRFEEAGERLVDPCLLRFPVPVPGEQIEWV
jgi:hypothetical protein